MMFSIVLVFLNLSFGFSVTFERSDKVIILFSSCQEVLNGKIVIEGASTRFEKDFFLDKVSLISDPNAYRGWVKSIPVDLEDNSKVTIQRVRENKVVKTDTFVWNDPTFFVPKKFDCLEIGIKKCSLIGPANKFEALKSCQSMQNILPKYVQPVGFLAVKFYPNSDKELSVSFNTKWEEETYVKGDFDINKQCLGISPIYDENNIIIRIGDGKESKLSIKNPRERQIFYHSKMKLHFEPFFRYNEEEYNYIFYINNIGDNKGKYFRTDEITISIFDNKRHQTRIASTRLLGRLIVGDSNVYFGKIMAFRQAQSVIVQIKGYSDGRAMNIGVLPIIYSQINHVDRIMVIPGSRENYFAVLLLSKKPITSLTDWYIVKIKAHPDDLRFEFCVRTVGKTCEFKYTDRYNSIQQFSVHISFIDNIFLRCDCKQWLLHTQFQTEETTTSIDISGVDVEVDIRRLPNNQKILYKSEVEDFMIKFPTMKKDKKMMI